MFSFIYFNSLVAASATLYTRYYVFHSTSWERSDVNSFFGFKGNNEMS